MEKTVNEYLKSGILERAKPGTWTTPAFIIFQNNKPRLISSFTKLNAKTVFYNHPLPNIQKIFMRAGKAKILSVCDTFKCFHQVKLSESTIYKAGIITPFGIFVWTRLPFGLANGATWFSGIMYAALSDREIMSTNSERS